jgi:hypothetical protein
MSYTRKSRWGKSERAEQALRLQRLSAPITHENIANFERHLLSVSFGANSECWLYSTVGEGESLPEDLNISTKSYAHVKFNGVTVGAHQFAFCAQKGITLAQLVGFDVHHVAKLGRCIGYRCVNPDHLDMVPSPLHRGTRGDRATLIRRQSHLVKEVLEVPASLRRPAEYRAGTVADARTRTLGGVTFLIRGGQIDRILEASSEEPPEPTP